MSTATEISRLSNARNTIRDKLIDLGLATSTDKLDALASAVDGITNRGAVSATVQEGDTYTIPAGYHNGSGTVSGVSGGGNYSLQAKGPITPTKSQQNIAPDNGYYGLSAVTIGAIPEAYQNVSSVTASAADVLSPKVVVASDGTTLTGSMPNNGAVSKTLDATSGNQSYTVPSGYHNGAGTVSIVLEETTVTPAAASQSVTPTTGKVLSKVIVASIPSKYGDTTSDTAVASNILSGIKAHSINNGAAVQITGTMANNGAVASVLDARTGRQQYTIPSGQHNGAGTVSIVLETKNATPSTSAQNITPTDGKVLSKVTVAAIPSKFGDTTGDTAVASNILAGIKAHTISGGAATQITGSMTNNGAINGNIDGLTYVSYAVPSGYTSGGTVALTSDIETALAAI